MMHSHEIPELEQIPQEIRVESSNLEFQLFLLNPRLGGCFVMAEFCWSSFSIWHIMG